MEQIIFTTIPSFNLQVGVAHQGQQAKITVIRPADNRNSELLMCVPDTRIVIIGGNTTVGLLRNLMTQYGKVSINRMLRANGNPNLTGHHKDMFSSRTYTKLIGAVFPDGKPQ